jgi:hypothetical protein
MNDHEIRNVLAGSGEVMPSLLRELLGDYLTRITALEQQVAALTGEMPAQPDHSA